MKRLALLLALGMATLGMAGALASDMRSRPFINRLGGVPNPVVLKILSADQRQSTAAYLVFKTLSYFGGLPTDSKGRDLLRPEYDAIQSLLETTAHLDPYNMDCYYFFQATFTWETNRVEAVNRLLDFGMQYRNWDFYLPFFAGFNAAYFLKDPASAIKYYQRAAELTGSPLFASLAGRYLAESGQTEAAIIYLSAMLEQSRDDQIRQRFAVRLEAFKALRLIETARDRFSSQQGHLPENVKQLVAEGYLSKMPTDPYGGSFEISPDGRVTTTSNFAFTHQKNK